MGKNTICLWYDKDAEAAARFYAEAFPDSVVGAVHRAPSDYPSGKAGDVLVVEFTVAGVPCINGGPAFKHNEAFSFQIATDDQDEYSWRAPSHGISNAISKIRLQSRNEKPVMFELPAAGR